MKASELLELLREFYREKMALKQRHVAAARLISDYDFNNTYQYIIAREDMHLTWVRDAITDMGGAVDDGPEPEVQASGRARHGYLRLQGSAAPEAR